MAYRRQTIPKASEPERQAVRPKPLLVRGVRAVCPAPRGACG